jgi:hypothetical protein
VFGTRTCRWMVRRSRHRPAQGIMGTCEQGPGWGSECFVLSCAGCFGLWRREGLGCGGDLGEAAAEAATGGGGGGGKWHTEVRAAIVGRREVVAAAGNDAVCWRSHQEREQLLLLLCLTSGCLGCAGWLQAAE